MTLISTLILALVGFLSGALGAIVGIGGGIIIIPVLALYFHLPFPQAIGASLISVIATSTATSSVHVERHVTDMKLGMTLELSTTVGAALAALVAHSVNRKVLAMLFIAFLMYSALSLLRKAWSTRSEKIEPEIPAYTVRRYPLGLAASLVAGAFSGLLGVGGGPIKVPVMYLFMGVPLRVATATSNFMIGVTAATSAYIYYGRGDIRLDVVAPLVMGVFSGSILGARLAPRVRAVYVQFLLIGIMIFLAIQMALRIVAGGLNP
jgi:uncharacterized membrane protein YfcA